MIGELITAEKELGTRGWGGEGGQQDSWWLKAQEGAS